MARTGLFRADPEGDIGKGHEPEPYRVPLLLLKTTQ